MIESEELAKYVRVKAIEMCSNGQSSHVGSVLSSADILAVLYSKILKYDANNPLQENRDRFILSKGHAGAGLYAVLAKCGFVNESILDSHYQNGSYLSGHVCHKLFPGIEFSTGSLGHGLPVSVGKSLAIKLKKLNSKVFCLMSDGELDEGSNWEAFLSASHHKLNNLVAIIDRNRLQSIEDTEKTLALEPLREKLISFGFNVAVIDGHCHITLKNTFENLSFKKPNIIIANTIKGKGVDFMENKVLWHYRSPSKHEVNISKEQIL